MAVQAPLLPPPLAPAAPGAPSGGLNSIPEEWGTYGPRKVSDAMAPMCLQTLFREVAEAADRVRVNGGKLPPDWQHGPLPPEAQAQKDEVSWQAWDGPARPCPWVCHLAGARPCAALCCAVQPSYRNTPHHRQNSTLSKHRCVRCR